MTSKISILAIDLAKGSFQVCAVGQDGVVVFNRAMSRTRLATLLADHPACIVAMEACATSHHWGRFAQSHGHEVRLVPAAYLKPFVKPRRTIARMQKPLRRQPCARQCVCGSEERRNARLCCRIPNASMYGSAAHAVVHNDLHSYRAPSQSDPLRYAICAPQWA